MTNIFVNIAATNADNTNNMFKNPRSSDRLAASDRRYSSLFPAVPLVVAMALISISLLTRVVLLFREFGNFDFGLRTVLGIFGIGLFYDLVNALYFVIPLMLIGWITSRRVSRKKWFLILIRSVVFLCIFLLLFNAVSEWIFWEEFSSRFNFIAVDYLVYTQEVVGNIQQSYPIPAIVSVLVVTSVLVTWLVWKIVWSTSFPELAFKQRSFVVMIYVAILAGAFWLVDNKVRQFSENTYVNELAGNGIYELFAAYRNNELDYRQFYLTEDDKDAFQIIRSLVHTRESQFTGTEPFSIERRIENKGPELRKNVVLISVESLSAEFLGSFGNTQGITPFLDSLAKESVLFTNLYATGTRTVRGLEALTLCTPPTPGQSIVRRPGNEDLFSLGSVFQAKGYESKFVYGGYGYFDNMGYFFAHNGYKVVDRTALSKKDVDYENIWGVADENLFTLAEREIDKSLKSGKPVFAHVMTTTNHRPFTYPSGRIDIPSHTSREGAVKYTDYAIGRFIKNAASKPWFKNTVFVIVADHCASSAGKTDLPVNRYKIPLLIFAPSFIKPAKVSRLMSQIDLAPTILGLLNFSYQSKFWGYDLFKLEEGRERAFISTYQSLGYVKHDSLIVLKPQKFSETTLPNFTDGSSTPTHPNEQLTREAVAWYQCASRQFKEGLMKRSR